MNVKWRLGVLITQLILLVTASYIVTGNFTSSEIWFFSGLLAIAINPQLWEPFYPRPADVIGNSLIGLFLYLVSNKTVAAIGWDFFAVAIIAAMITGIVAVVFGKKNDLTTKSLLARTATVLSRNASAVTIYSTVFWLSAIEFRPSLNKDFWVLTIAWAVIVFVGKVNWQALWSTATGRPLPCRVEGMVGPSILLVSSSTLPPASTIVRIRTSDVACQAIVLARISRAGDIWGQLHLEDGRVAEQFLQKQLLAIEPIASGSCRLIGSVDEESNHEKLKFIATHVHTIGEVVSVPHGDVEILYQLSSAHIDQSKIKGGSHLIVQATANQLGIFDMSNQRLRRYKWAPDPGAPVFSPIGADAFDNLEVPNGAVLLGDVIGTRVPIYVDLEVLREGHLAILGMTKMGKTTLAVRLAHSLSASNRVTILDQTGEYIAKRGFTQYQEADDDQTTGYSVLEPAPGSVAADEALRFLKRVVEKAGTEYSVGVPKRRILILDEAHQFIPEPSGLGFNAPGRDSAYQFGLLMMQVRKYGIAVILISQRTAVVAKSALSQCENVIAFKSVDQTGLDYLESVLGQIARDLLPSLVQGEALIFGPAFSSDTAVGVKIREA